MSHKSHIQHQGLPWCCRPHGNAVLDQVEEAARAARLPLSCQGTSEQNKVAVAFLQANGVDAVLVDGPCQPPESHSY
jgi:hypothetical protein